MAGKMRVIYRDGKRYEFTPGENGSTIVRGTPKPPSLVADLNRPRVAKSIGPAPGTPDIAAGMPARKKMAKVIMPKKQDDAMPKLAMRNGKFDLEDRAR